MKKLFLFLLLNIFLLQILIADPVFRQAKNPQEETTGFGWWKEYIYTFTDSEMKSSQILVIIDNQYQENSAYNGTFKITLKEKPTSIKLYYQLPETEISYRKNVDNNGKNPSNPDSRQYILKYTFTGKKQYNNQSVTFLVYLSEVKNSANKYKIGPEIRSAASAGVILNQEKTIDLGIDTTKDTYSGIIAAIID